MTHYNGNGYKFQNKLLGKSLLKPVEQNDIGQKNHCSVYSQ